MKYLVVIPTYNEADNIIVLLEQIIKAYPAVHVLVVDDNSPDGTAKLVKDFIVKYPGRVFILERAKKLGLGSAYKQAFAWALAQGYDFVISMDADESHQVSDIDKLISASLNRDIVLASRKIAGGQIVGWNAWRHFTSNSAMGLSRFILRLNTRDVTAGFKCYSRRFVEFLMNKNIRSDGYAWQIETIFLAEKNNFSIEEVPTTFIDRRRGQSKLSLKDAAEFFINVIKLKLKP